MIGSYWHKITGNQDSYTILKEREMVALEVLSQIPEHEKEALVAYDCYTGIYLTADVCPYYRFFTLQDWNIAHGEELLIQIRETFNEGDAKWILLQNEGQEVKINDILQEKYICVERVLMPYTDNSYYELYQIKDKNIG